MSGLEHPEIETAVSCFLLYAASGAKWVSRRRLPSRLDAELLPGNGRQKRNDVALDFDLARFLGLNHEVVFELAAAESLVAQMEGQHFVPGAAQGNLLRRNVLDDEENLSLLFLLFDLALLFGLSLFMLMVTLVWLYLEILRLLAKLNNRK
jgi:hypothetical protein